MDNDQTHPLGSPEVETAAVPVHTDLPAVTPGISPAPDTSIASDGETFTVPARCDLTVEVRVLEKVYETGRKYAVGFKETMKIVSDEFLPRWNYRAVPEPG